MWHKRVQSDDNLASFIGFVSFRCTTAAANEIMEWGRAQFGPPSISARAVMTCRWYYAAHAMGADFYQFTFYYRRDSDAVLFKLRWSDEMLPLEED